jgi:hypothetical protein
MKLSLAPAHLCMEASDAELWEKIAINPPWNYFRVHNYITINASITRN